MARLDNTTFRFSCLQYKSEEISSFEETDSVEFTSEQQTYNVRCPHCNGPVIGHGQKTVKLKDIPLIPGRPMTFVVHQH